MEVYCTVRSDSVFNVMMWGVLLILLLLLGGFIKVGTWSNFNCGFSMWNGSVSFDGIKLLVVFIIFEMEIIVVVIMISDLILLSLMIVTVFELLMLYI